MQGIHSIGIIFPYSLLPTNKLGVTQVWKVVDSLIDLHSTAELQSPGLAGALADLEWLGVR